MSQGLNRVILIGNIGNDPEIRTTNSGTRVAKLSLATNRTRKDQSGTSKDETQWHRVTFFGKLVDVIEQWVKKGDRICVEGRIEYSTSEHEGTTRYWTDIIATELLMLGANMRDTTDGEPRQQEAPEDDGGSLPF